MTFLHLRVSSNLHSTLKQSEPLTQCFCVFLGGLSGRGPLVLSSYAYVSLSDRSFSRCTMPSPMACVLDVGMSLFPMILFCAHIELI